MSIHCPNLKGIVAALAVIVTFSIPLAAKSDEAPTAAAESPGSVADLQDEAALLDALASADAIEAKRLDRQLQALWSKSGSPSLDLLLKRGRDALEVDDVDAAIEHLTALTDHAPDFAEGFHARASAYFSAELYGPAMADLERALALNPHNYDAIYGLGAMLETFGYTQRAYEAYLQALELNPHQEDVARAVERLKPGITGKTL